MLISYKKKFVFVHVYKNAGTSITKALLPHSDILWIYYLKKIYGKIFLTQTQRSNDKTKHLRAEQIISKIGKDKFNSLFSFAFVRNPWDWQVSLYNYMLRDTFHYQHKIVKNLSNFSDYIKWRCNESLVLQKDFIYSQSGELLINFVGRYENLSVDFETICNKLNIQSTLPYLNSSHSESYRSYYDDKSIDLIRDLYREDIELFGYDF